MLELRSVATGYGDLKVVRDVSFTIPAGTVTALLGRNGVGKTTTLRAISGLNALTGGEILLDGERIDRLRAFRRPAVGIGYVQEGKRVFRQLSVEENLNLGAFSSKVPRGEILTRRDEAYARFPILHEKRHAPASSMSGGQQQMLAIAQALMASPKVLLLDEPSGGLAPAIVGEVLETVRSLTQGGMAVLLVEQAVNFALAVADQIVLMDLGKVTFTGVRDDPRIHDEIEAAYFARSNEAIAEEAKH